MPPFISECPMGLFRYNDKVWRAPSKRKLAHWLVYESTYFPPPSCMVTPTPQEVIEDIISKTEYIEPIDKRVNKKVGYDAKRDMMYFKITTPIE